MAPSTLRRRNLKTQQSPVIYHLCLSKTRAGEDHDYRNFIVYEKLRLQNVFPSTLKRKAGVFKFLRCGERFRKAPFPWRISVDGMPNRRNKAPFSNSLCVVWTGPELSNFLRNIVWGHVRLLCHLNHERKISIFLLVVNRCLMTMISRYLQFCCRWARVSSVAITWLLIMVLWCLLTW